MDNRQEMLFAKTTKKTLSLAHLLLSKQLAQEDAPSKASGFRKLGELVQPVPALREALTLSNRTQDKTREGKRRVEKSRLISSPHLAYPTP